MATPSVRTGTPALLLALCFLAITAVSGFAAETGEGAHHADSAVQLKDFGWRVFNFAVLAGIIGWAIAKAKVKKALSERQAQIETSLREASQAREAAERKLREYTTKLDQASREIDEMRAAMLSEADREKQRIIVAAQDAAQKIAVQTALSAEQETLKARLALQAEASRLAVDLAASKLAGAIRKEDHDRYIGEYLDKAGQL